MLLCVVVVAGEAVAQAVVRFSTLFVAVCSHTLSVACAMVLEPHCSMALRLLTLSLPTCAVCVCVCCIPRPKHTHTRTQVYLVGDPVQLPATVISGRALDQGYDVSLFKRLQVCRGVGGWAGVHSYFEMHVTRRDTPHRGLCVCEQ